MNIGDVCKIVKELKDEGHKYIADECVRKGYGQTCGGYLSLKNTKPTFITQKAHFLSYYDNLDMQSNRPTFHFLRCPQLLLFIAEFSGVPESKIKDAYKLLKEYEKNNGLYKTNKSGNYLWDRNDGFLSKFKGKLGIYSLAKTIDKASNWDEVKEQIKGL